MEFEKYSIILIILSVVFILIVIKFKLISKVINSLPIIHKYLFRLRSRFKRKHYQHYFYGVELYNEHPNIFGKKYLKLNNYLFRLNPVNKIIKKNLKKKFSKIIIIFASKYSNYFRYVLDNLKFNRNVDKNAVNFFKLNVQNKTTIKMQLNTNDHILKQFYILKKSKKKLVLILLVDGLSNYFSNGFFKTKKYFSSSNKLENVWSNSAWTLPTWSNLITGNYTSRHLNYAPRSYYNSNPSDEEISTSIKSKFTLSEFFKKSNFITASYSPYPRINPTYNFDRGFDIMRYCENQNNSEILEDITSHIELFNDSSNFILAHLMDMHHLAKGYKMLGDFAYFPDGNYDYHTNTERKHLQKNFSEKDEFIAPKNFYEEKDLEGIIKSTDQKLSYFFNYLSNKKFDDFTFILLGDHGTRIQKFSSDGSILTDNHQNIGFFIKDKKTKSFASKKNKTIETIDIFPSLVSRYTNNQSKKIQDYCDGKNTIFSKQKKECHIAESIYGAEYDLLFKFKKNYLITNYKIDNNLIKKKIKSEILSNKKKLIKFNKKNKVIKKLNSIEEQHIKNSNLKIYEKKN